MALTTTIYTFNIELADADRGVCKTLDLRVACHPSETEEYLGWIAPNSIPSEGGDASVRR